MAWLISESDDLNACYRDHHLTMLSTFSGFRCVSCRGVSGLGLGYFAWIRKQNRYLVSLLCGGGVTGIVSEL